MNAVKGFGAILTTLLLMAVVGCAPTKTHEGTGQYVDDSVITTKVKAAILGEPGLKSSEINVETFKGVVQLSGFVTSSADISTATKVANAVAGVTSVKNDMVYDICDQVVGERIATHGELSQSTFPSFARRSSIILFLASLLRVSAPASEPS